VLLKGGHLEDDGPGSLGLDDLLMLADGTVRVYTHPRVDTPNLHGTGCTLAAAIAAQLARATRCPMQSPPRSTSSRKPSLGRPAAPWRRQRPLNHSFAPRAGLIARIAKTMQTLTNIDLREDRAANWYVKDETVQVAFATEPGELISREGPNRYQPGDAIVTGATGDRWVVSRGRFDPRYVAVGPNAHGESGPIATSRCRCWPRRCRTHSRLRVRPAAMC
jgi:hypothetical protein